MTRKMLINAQSPEQLRVAIVEESRLDDLQIEVADSGLTRGNIYRGIIVNIQPSLNASFIDYGGERHGFLPIQDVVPEARYHQPKGDGRPRIEEVLERGKPIVVQVVHDPVGDKGAALTTDLSLPGRYLVLRPFDDTRGISRKVEDEETRQRLKELASKLDVPKGCGFIVRTNALDQNKTALQRDLAALLRLWKRVQQEARQGRGTKLLYSDQDLILRALRDHLDSSVSEVIVDDDRAYEKAEQTLKAFMPRGKTRLVRYTDRHPLFARFGLEEQIERIYKRTVPLASGGSIVIDGTEALTAIDVNSGRSTRASSQEETAYQTNLEAAGEVARQLRLRDIGGIVVVDFIDMKAGKHRRKVEKAMRDAMKADRARSSVGRISSNGLLEVNRQRLQQALAIRTHRTCPTCDGAGRILSPDMVGLSLLRRIEARASSGRLRRVRVELHPELADAIQNDRRHELASLEQEFGLDIEIIASSSLHRAEEKISWEAKSKEEAERNAETLAAVQARDLAEAQAAGEAQGGKSRRRRRRRPRSRGSSEPKEAAKNGSSPESGGAEARGEPQSAKGNGSPEAAAEGDGQGKSRNRRRRPRRRRRSRSSSEGTSAEAG